MDQSSVIGERLLRDMRLAAEVQRSLLPEAVPSVAGYSFWATTEQCLEGLGGDLHDFHRLATGEIVVLVSDVAGKGIAAAVAMAALAGMISTAVHPFVNDLGGMIGFINQLYCSRLGRSGRFATLTAASLNPLTHQVAIVNASQEPGLIRRADGTVVDLVPNDKTGLPLGVFDGFVYEVLPCDLAPGDLVLLATDGITHALNTSEKPYGLPRLRELVARSEPCPEKLGTTIMADVKAFIGDSPFRDDATVVCFGRNTARVAQPTVVT